MSPAPRGIKGTLTRLAPCHPLSAPPTPRESSICQLGFQLFYDADLGERAQRERSQEAGKGLSPCLGELQSPPLLGRNAENRQRQLRREQREASPAPLRGEGGRGLSGRDNSVMSWEGL